MFYIEYILQIYTDARYFLNGLQTFLCGTHMGFRKGCLMGPELGLAVGSTMDPPVFAQVLYGF